MNMENNENVSVDSILQNHGYVEDLESIHSFQKFLDRNFEESSAHFGKLIYTVLAGYIAYCSLCGHCWFYDCDFGTCTLTECSYRPYRKEADDE